MNKTVSVHLQGIPFVIEESAYELLKNYLDQLTDVLKQEEGANEILKFAWPNCLPKHLNLPKK
jgi:hypothetical protein